MGVFLGLLVILSLTALADYTYAFHWSRAAGQDLEINVCNTAEIETNYSLKLYDPWGKLVWETTAKLQPFDAAYHTVSEQVLEGESLWGMAIVTSTTPVLIGLQYMLQGKPQSLDLVGPLCLTCTSAPAFVIPVYYTQVPGSQTAIIVMNPNAQGIKGRLVIYQSDGKVAIQGTFQLAAYESNSYSLAKLVGEGTKFWGLATVLSEGGPVAVAMKFLVEGSLYVQHAGLPIPLQAAPATPTPQPPRKE
jgi:hypothetical protein